MQPNTTIATETDAHGTLHQAAIVTRAVAAAADLALDVLATQFPAPTNQHRIYADPARVQAALFDVVTVLKAALVTMQSTEWPRPADYDSAGGPAAGA